MKKGLALLYALAFAMPCSAGTTGDIFSPIPSWVSRTSISPLPPTWDAFNRRKDLLAEREHRESTLFDVRYRNSHLGLRYFKVQDYRLGRPPSERDYSKEFLVPLPEDFNAFNRSSLRLRPSWKLGKDIPLTEYWKIEDTTITGKHFKINDGKVEFALIFNGTFR